MRTRQVLPAPLGPMRVSILPGSRARSTPSSTLRPSRARRMPSSSSRGVVIVSLYLLAALFLAVAAQAGEFKGLAVDVEAGRAGGFVDGIPQPGGISNLFGIAAGLAEQEVTGVGGARMRAAYKGITGGNAMNQLLLQQEVQRAVHRRRCRLVPFGRELIEQLIGAQRTVAVPDQLQHTPAQGRQTGTTFRAELLG